jgi:hypothetical protein
MLGGNSALVFGSGLAMDLIFLVLVEFVMETKISEIDP